MKRSAFVMVEAEPDADKAIKVPSAEKLISVLSVMTYTTPGFIVKSVFSKNLGISMIRIPSAELKRNSTLNISLQLQSAPKKFAILFVYSFDSPRPKQRRRSFATKWYQR